jgi:hypothetical protein
MAIYSSQTSVDFHTTMQRYMTEDRTLHSHPCESLRSMSNIIYRYKHTTDFMKIYNIYATYKRWFLRMPYERLLWTTGISFRKAAYSECLEPPKLFYMILGYVCASWWTEFWFCSLSWLYHHPNGLKTPTCLKRTSCVLWGERMKLAYKRDAAFVYPSGCPETTERFLFCYLVFEWKLLH